MFSLLDVILVVMMLISGILAMIRGFLREFLSIASWGAAVLAVLLTFKYFPDITTLFEPFIGHKLAAQLVMSFLIFLIVLVIVHLITIVASDRVLNSAFGALDHTLGFIFGLLRGLVAVVLLYLFFSSLVRPEVHDQWVKNSRSLPLVQSTGEMIVSLLPDDLAKTLSDQFKKNASKQPDDGDIGSRLKRSASSAPNREYKANDRQGMNQLVESVNSARN